MQVDWFTIIAQAFNFLVLLWVMKRFLYKPILSAIDKREKRIADQIATAEAMKVEAKEQRDEYDSKNERLEREKAELMDAAKAVAQTERQRLLDEARKAADDYSARRRNALKDEELALRDDIKRRTREEVYALTRDALKSLAGTSLEERIVELFNDHLRTMGAAEVQVLRTALTGSNDSVTVRTGLHLEEQQKSKTKTTIKNLLGADTQIVFDTAPELISGIELNANGHKAAWSIDEYLSSVDGTGVNAHES